MSVMEIIISFQLLFEFLENTYLDFFGYDLSLFDIAIGLFFLGILGFIFYKIFD